MVWFLCKVILLLIYRYSDIFIYTLLLTWSDSTCFDLKIRYREGLVAETYLVEVCKLAGWYAVPSTRIAVDGIINYLAPLVPSESMPTSRSRQRFSDQPMRFETSILKVKLLSVPSSCLFILARPLRWTSSSSPPKENKVWEVRVGWHWPKMIASCSTFKSETRVMFFPSCTALPFLSLTQ